MSVLVCPISMSQCPCPHLIESFAYELRINVLLQIAIFTFKMHLIEGVISILKSGQFESNKILFIIITVSRKSMKRITIYY